MKTINRISDRFIPNKIDRLNRLPRISFPRFIIRHCKIKILIVTDFGASFDDNNFGLTDFIKAFDDPIQYTSFDIKKAHRRTDANADFNNFKFDNSINEYDVIFLFGVERPASRPFNNPTGNALSDNELKAISKYMDNGGGLFATGDHEDLGVDMCGKIPRIKSMRRWYTANNPGTDGEPFAPDQVGQNRHDTLVDLDPMTPGLQGNQTDLTPQNISPEYWYGRAYFGTTPHSILDFKKYPHPVLCSPDGVIRYLPDHMHEGLCEIPSDLTKSHTFSGYTSEEYPLINGQRLRPELVAKATNQVNNSKFGVIAALDGHKHNSIGRVLVDATWHHFFNINIRQYQELKELVDTGGYNPTQEEASALEKYNYIQHYFRNIAYWLAKREKQDCFRIRGFQWLLNHNSIAMSLITNIEKKRRLDQLVYFNTLGVLAKDALGDLQAICQSPAFIFTSGIFPISQKIQPRLESGNLSFINEELFDNVCLGCTLHNLHETLLNNKGEISDNKFFEVVENSTLDSMESIIRSASFSISSVRRKVKKARNRK